MKVMCINEDWTDGGEVFDFPTPIVGGEYGVVDCKYIEKKRYYDKDLHAYITEIEGIYYKIIGFNHWYHSMNFSTLQADSKPESITEEIETA